MSTLIYLCCPLRTLRNGRLINQKCYFSFLLELHIPFYKLTNGIEITYLISLLLSVTVALIPDHWKSLSLVLKRRGSQRRGSQLFFFLCSSKQCLSCYYHTSFLFYHHFTQARHVVYSFFPPNTLAFNMFSTASLFVSKTSPSFFFTKVIYNAFLGLNQSQCISSQLSCIHIWK